MLIKLVKNYFRLGVTFDFQHNPYTILIRFVAQIRNAFYFLFVNKISDRFHQIAFVKLIGNLGNHNLRAVFFMFDCGFSADGKLTLTFLIHPHDFALAADDAAGGKIRPLDITAKLFDARAGIIDNISDGIADFGDVVAGNISRHAYGDTTGAID